MTNWVDGVCEANGIRIHYLRTGGAKPPLVLLHGLTGSGACWAPLARALEDEFDVVMPDARGHGGSSAPDDGYRYDDLASDVVGLVRGLGLIRGVVLVDPTFLSPERQRQVHQSDVADEHRRALGLSQAELVAQARARHPRRSPEILALQAEARRQTRPAAFDVLTPPNPDYRELVRAIDVPCLLVIGDDPVVTFAMATELRSLNARLRIEVVEDAGHGLPFDRPGRLAELSAGFLRQLP